MGFFSWDCPGCNTPILGHMATNHKTRWMKDCTVVFQSGDKVTGSYDGYGRVDGIQFFNDYDQEPPYPTYAEEKVRSDPAELWHSKCWELAGSPGYEKPNEGSLDQGWFFDEGHYDSNVPGTPFTPPKYEEYVHEGLESSVPSD